MAEHVWKTQSDGQLVYSGVFHTFMGDLTRVDALLLEPLGDWDTVVFYVGDLPLVTIKSISDGEHCRFAEALHRYQVGRTQCC